MKELTPVQMQVVILITEGYTNHQIGGALHVTEETVKTYVSRILRKMAAKNRAHIVTIAFRKGIIK